MRIVTALAATLAGLAACAAAAPIAADDPYALRPGLYEVTVSFVEMRPALDARTQEALRAAGSGRPERQCFGAQDVVHRVGGTFAEGRCRNMEVVYDGPRVQRLASCEGARGGRTSVAFAGTRSPETYDYRITIQGALPTDGSEQRVVVTREQGRRIGDCAPSAS